MTHVLASLPIIDIAPYLEAERDPTKCQFTSDALHNACVEYGFFYLDISQFIDPSEPEKLTRLAREFFTLPQEEKDKIGLEHQDYARGVSQFKRSLSQNFELLIQDTKGSSRM
jgi:isopenicillin N synthase-like dioxygenase